MSFAAVKEPYLLLIMQDDEPTNPREDYDNFGHMNCWHRRYNLGDKHDYEDTNELLKALVLDSVKADTVIDRVKSGKVEGVKLEYDRSAKGWQIASYDSQYKKWFDEAFYEGTMEENKQYIFESLLDTLPSADLYKLATEKNIILPLNLYDHSGISMSVTSFLGRAQHAEWDSGQVGWIYATPEDIRKEYGDTSPESMAKAESLLNGEVETYNYYLIGECYAFRLYKDGEKIEGGWDLLGNFSEVAHEIAVQNLPETHQDMIDNMLEISDTYTRSKNYEDYMEELEEMEA